MNTSQDFWRKKWDEKAKAPTDFQATGRGSMDTIGFLYSLADVAGYLDIQRNDTLLDMGCGTGIIALALAPWVDKIEGIDYSSKMVERAKANCKYVDKIALQQGDIRSLPFPAEMFDKILGYSILQYLSTGEELSQTLEEAYRVLKPGGKAYFADNPNGAKKEDFLVAVGKALSNDPQHKETTFQNIRQSQWFSPPACIELATKCGFTAKILPVHPRIWQNSYVKNLHEFYFNLLLSKEKR